MSQESVMTPAQFQAATGCSDLVLARLTLYADLLVKWQEKINLVSRTTVPDLWRRHFLDSAQLFPLLPVGAETLVDLGSGAGFPALVLAAMGVPEVHLVESDGRKGVFLREAAREMGIKVTVHTRRIEAVEPFPADIITSRALAPLTDLLEFSTPFFKKSTVCLFLKGKNVQSELTDSAKKWNMAVERIPSVTDSSGVVVKLEGVTRHHGLDQSQRLR